MRAAFVALLLLAPALVAADARQLTASETVTVLALAVAETPEGFVGVGATVHATVLGNGTGQVFVDTKPLAQTDMQGSARLAARVAASTLGQRWNQFDYLIVFRSDSVVIGGPSAGSVMTLALTVALHNLLEPEDPWEIDERVAGTGTINPDGTIGPVGGVPEKAGAARNLGVTLFMFPAGQEQAARIVMTPAGPVQEAVTMGEYCREELGIECRPAATVRDLLENAVGVRLAPPRDPIPTTSEYREVLEPRILPELEAFRARLLEAQRALNRTALGDDEAGAALDALVEARDKLVRADAAVGAGRYYTAATMAFQGNFWTGYGENLTVFFERGRPANLVRDAVAACADSVDRAEAYAYPINATGLQEIFAVGAAQTRVREARALQAEAEALFQGAASVEDWLRALFNSSFCVERSRTVVWWTDLRDAFGPGPSIDEPEALALEQIELARELATYADEVLQQIGGADRALRLLSEARADLEQGRASAAVERAVEAQAEASLAVQVAGGQGTVPPQVIAAAREAAGHAIAGARGAGIEPILSVSLVELAEDLTGQPEAALSYLWTARALAALTPDQAPPQVDSTFVGPSPYVVNPGGAPVATRTGIAAGFILGVFFMAVIVLVAGALGGRKGQ